MNDAGIADDKKLIWKDEYSVGVKVIDDQHKQLFDVINGLIVALNKSPDEAMLLDTINRIAEYKRIHFATEERYFHEFAYAGAAEHEAQHRKFNETLASLQERYKGDTVGFAFGLVDFLEDWLIGHLMRMDQLYKECFHEHGLR